MKEHHLANIVSAVGLTFSLANINQLLTMVSLLVAIGLNIHLIYKNYKK
jgi:hypothetical protein